MLQSFDRLECKRPYVVFEVNHLNQNLSDQTDDGAAVLLPVALDRVQDAVGAEERSLCVPPLTRYKRAKLESTWTAAANEKQWWIRKCIGECLG